MCGIPHDALALSCKSRTAFGTLQLTVDVSNHVLQVDAPDYPGHPRWIYRDGALAPTLVRGPDRLAAREPVEHIMMVTRAHIIVGWRGDTGQLDHASWFNRSALDPKPAACRWHSFRIIESASLMRAPFLKPEFNLSIESIS